MHLRRRARRVTLGELEEQRILAILTGIIYAVHTLNEEPSIEKSLDRAADILEAVKKKMRSRRQ
jgi:hypothetical protein